MEVEDAVVAVQGHVAEGHGVVEKKVDQVGRGRIGPLELEHFSMPGHDFRYRNFKLCLMNEVSFEFVGKHVAKIENVSQDIFAMLLYFFVLLIQNYEIVEFPSFRIIIYASGNL